MNPRNRTDVENALEKKGFKKNQNDHRKFIYHMLSGQKTAVWTKTSHGSSHRELSPSNLSRMARQCQLSGKDFELLIDCPLSQSMYEMKLINKENSSGRGVKS
jgi:hypothetical protein